MVYTILAQKRLLCRRQRFRACGRVRSLNRRGQRPLVSADSFGFLFVATGEESLTPQRAFRSPFGNLRGHPLNAMLLMQHSIKSVQHSIKERRRSSALWRSAFALPFITRSWCGCSRYSRTRTDVSQYPYRPFCRAGRGCTDWCTAFPCPCFPHGNPHPAP